MMVIVLILMAFAGICAYNIGRIDGRNRELRLIERYHRATVDRLASERGYYSPSLTGFIAGVKGLEHRK